MPRALPASTMMLVSVLIVLDPLSIFRSLGGASMADSADVHSLDGPRGPKPRKTLSRRNIILYGTLFVVAVYYLIPLYVMLVTSVKGMPEIRMGNIFSLPLEITFEPWVKAWSQACTGLNCDGLSRGFWNSVKITIPSVVISIAIASINGYALANWRFQRSKSLFHRTDIWRLYPLSDYALPTCHNTVTRFRPLHETPGLDYDSLLSLECQF